MLALLAHVWLVDVHDELAPLINTVESSKPFVLRLYCPLSKQFVATKLYDVLEAL